MGGTKRKFRSCRRKKRSQNSKKAKQCNDDIQISSSNNNNIGDPAPSTSNVSDRKLSGKNPAPSNNSTEGVQGNRFIDMDILAPVFHIFPCPNCFKKTLKLVETYRYGLACKFEIFCQECQWNYSFLNTKKTKRCYQINRRAYYAMRRVGGGHERLKRFFFLMNHPPPVKLLLL